MLNPDGGFISILLKENEKILINKEFESEITRKLKYNPIDLERFFENKDEALYYRFVICEKVPVDAFFEGFKIDKKQCEDNYQAHYEKAKDNLKQYIFKNLKIKINVDTYSYNEEILKGLFSYVQQAKKIVDNVDIALWREPKDGFTKELLTKFMDIQSQNVDVSVVDSGAVTGSYVSLEAAILCYEKFERQIEFIKEKKLSPFEQFLLVHDIVSDRIYKESDCFLESDKCRNFIQVMTQDDIVCAGYATMMQHFCEKLGIPCFYITGNKKENEQNDSIIRLNKGHAANIVYIEDEKYDIRGYYFCDACWDSKTNDEIPSKYFYSALPMQDLDKIGQSDFFRFDELKQDIQELPNKSEPISYKKFSLALKSIYENDNFESEVITQNLNKLDKDVKFVRAYCKPNSQNGFYTEYQRKLKNDNHYICNEKIK